MTVISLIMLPNVCIRGREQLFPVFYQVGCALGHHDNWCIQVSTHDGWHRARINNLKKGMLVWTELSTNFQVFSSVDTHSFRIHYRHLVISRSHFASTRRVIRWSGLFLHEPINVCIRLTLLSGSQFFPTEIVKCFRGKELSRQPDASAELSPIGVFVHVVRVDDWRPSWVFGLKHHVSFRFGSHWANMYLGRRVNSWTLIETILDIHGTFR